MEHAEPAATDAEQYTEQCRSEDAELERQMMMQMQQEAYEEELGLQWEAQQAASGASSSSMDGFHSPQGKIDKAMPLGFSLKTFKDLKF